MPPEDRLIQLMDWISCKYCVGTTSCLPQKQSQTIELQSTKRPNFNNILLGFHLNHILLIAGTTSIFISNCSKGCCGYIFNNNHDKCFKKWLWYSGSLETAIWLGEKQTFRQTTKQTILIIKVNSIDKL